MLSSRIRTTILTLAAVTAMSATAAPTAGAQAKGNADPATCAEWLEWFKGDVKRANEAVTKGQPAEVTKAYAEAANELKNAKDAGCEWAATTAPPKAPATPVNATVVVRVAQAH
jgi:hypothetical protein